MQRREFLLAGSAAMLWSTPLFAQTRRDVVDVVVIGAGGAGLSAAITAADAGAKVLVLEKMPVIGGNTQLAAGGMNAAETRIQAAKGIKDDWRVMYEDTMKGGHDRNQPDLVEIMTKGSAAAVDWLTGLGVKFSPSVHFSGGARIERSHEPDGGGAFGPYVTRVLLDNAVKRNVAIRRNSKVMEILQRPDGGVRGIVVQDRRGALYTIEDQGDRDRLRRLWQQPGEDRQAQARICQVHQHRSAGHDRRCARLRRAHRRRNLRSRSDPDPSHPGGWRQDADQRIAVRGGGAILVNRDGMRFSNELGTRDRTSAKVLAAEGADGVRRVRREPQTAPQDDRGLFPSRPGEAGRYARGAGEAGGHRRREFRSHHRDLQQVPGGQERSRVPAR